MIGPELEADLWRVIVGKAQRLGAMVHAVGGVEDHIHLVASVPPEIAVAEFVAQLKGSSSHFANHRPGTSVPFVWQPEYGVLSFDGKKLDDVVRYVKNQREHHQRKSTFPVFEKAMAEHNDQAGR